MAKRAAKIVAPVDPVAEVPSGPVNFQKLSALVNATVAGGFLYVPASDTDLQRLLSLSLADINENIKDESGNVAAKATDQGIKYMDLNAPQPEVSAQPAPISAPVAASKPSAASQFEIDDDVELPTIKRGGVGRQPTFPFEALGVGQSFHVAISEDRPDPAKSLASTVSSANARYAKETGEFEEVTVSTYKTDASGKRVKENGHYVRTGEQTVKRAKTTQEREFVLRSVDASDKRGPGARVFRLR